MRPAESRIAGFLRSTSRMPRLHTVPDAFEQELLTDIAEADAYGESALAAEWQLELRSYRKAKQQAALEAESWSSSVARREALAKAKADPP